MKSLEQDDEISLAYREKSNCKRNILRYVLVAFSSLIYAYFFGGFFPYTLLYLTLALPVMSILHLIVTCTLFCMSERLNEHTFVKGECASYYLILQNSSFLYMPYITVRMNMEGQIICKTLKSMRLSLAPYATREFQYDMPLLFRGRYDIGVKSIKISDILGLFSYTFYPLEKKSILVKPRIIEIPYKETSIFYNTEGKLTSGYNEVGNDELIDIREYAYGDSLRKIHWKLSSKLGKTMVKETRNELDNDVVIILNLKTPEIMDEAALLREDCLLEGLVSQINYLLIQNIPVKLCFFKDGPICLRATTFLDFHGLYQLLSEIKFNKKYDFIYTLEYFSDTERNSNPIYLFTITLDGDIVSKTFHIQNKGFNMELYYVRLEGSAENDDLASQDLTDMLIKSNIRAYNLEPTAIQVEGFQREVENKTAKVGVKAYEN